MTTCQSQTVITLIDKGKDRTLLKTGVYKILSKVLADKLKAVLPNFISEDHIGFITGRNITDNKGIILDLVHCTLKEDIPGILIHIDFEKRVPFSESEIYGNCAWREI